MFFSNKVAFTLVELIVVITILSILGTIAFVSFQGYSTNARESTRISDISSLSRSLEYYKLKNDFYPTPDESITLLASGSIIGYQWKAGRTLLNSIGFASEGTDPLDGTYYGYYVLQWARHMQLIGKMEKPDSTALVLPIEKAYAVESEVPRYAKLVGNKLWIITNSQNIPIHEISTGSIDLINTPETYRAYISKDIFYTWTGAELRYAVPKSSCQRLADLNLGWPSGYYTINIIGAKDLEVYCDFSREWEGLTMIARSVNNVVYNGSSFWWFVSRWSPKDDTQPFSLGTLIRDIPFQKIYLTVYDTGKNITGETTLDVTDVNIFQWAYAATAINVEGCVGADIWGWNTSCTLFNRWWKFNSVTSYWFSNNPANTTDGLNARRYGATFPFPGMIFVK